MMLLPLILSSCFMLALPRACAPVDKASWLSGVSFSHELYVTTSTRTERAQEPILDRDTGAGLTFEQDRPRLDQFAEDLKKFPNSRAYIIAYGGSVGPAGEAMIRLKCLRQYLKNRHRISSSRLVLVDGGYRSEISVELFLVQTSDSKPAPTPTVKPSRVRIIKVRKNDCR